MIHQRNSLMSYARLGALGVAMATASLGACRDAGAGLIGQWDLTEMNMVSAAGARQSGPVGSLGSVIFHEDKSYVLRSTSYGRVSVNRGKWLLDGNELVLDVVESDTRETIGQQFRQRMSLNGDKLVLTWQHPDQADTSNVATDFVYRRAGSR